MEAEAEVKVAGDGEKAKGGKTMEASVDNKGARLAGAQNEEVARKDPERASEVLDQNLESLSSDIHLTPVLADAIGMTAEYDKRRKASEENIQRQYFKNDEKGFRLWKSDLTKVQRDIKLRDGIRQYEESQTRQFIKIQNGMNAERRDRAQRSLVQTQNNAALSELAERRHTAQTEYESAWATKEKAKDAFMGLDAEKRKAAGDDKEKTATLDDELGRQSVKFTEDFAAIQKKKDDALALAKADYDAQMAKNRQELRDWYREEVRRETQFQMKAGYGEATAFNIAVASVGKRAEIMLKGLVDSGQADFVQTLLDELAKPGVDLKEVPRMGHDGKPAVDGNGKQMVDYEYDPHGRLCMSVEQVDGVQDYLDKKVAADIQRKKLIQKQNEDAFDLAASKIRSEVNQLDVMPTLDMERVKQLYEAANQLSAQGYDKAHLVTANITSVVNRHARMAQAQARREATAAAKAAKAQTKELGERAFIDQINQYNARPDGVFKVDMMLPDDTGKPIMTTVELNVNNAVAHTIKTAQSLGYLKGETWTKMMGEALAAEPQRKVVETAINEMFDFPVEGTYYGYDRRKGKNGWLSRPDGASTSITIDFADHGSVKPGNVSVGNRVRMKIPIDVDGGWGHKEATGYLDYDQLERVVQAAHRFVKDNPAATKESLMAHLGKVRDAVRYGKAAEEYGERFAREMTRATDDYFNRDVYGGKSGGEFKVAVGRTPVGQMISQSAMNARYNPAYAPLTKNAILFGDDEEPDENAMRDDAAEE